MCFRFGDRFLAMNNCYDRAIRKMANAVTRNIKKKTTFHEGTYAMLCGPNFGKQNMYIIQYEKIMKCGRRIITVMY